eukprot:NP_001022959.1 Uncharacterized protein CELE_Y82E9BR.14 [Caenorhabditis elegans]
MPILSKNLEFLAYSMKKTEKIRIFWRFFEKNRISCIFQENPRISQHFFVETVNCSVFSEKKSKIFGIFHRKTEFFLAFFEKKLNFSWKNTKILIKNPNFSEFFGENPFLWEKHEFFEKKIQFSIQISNFSAFLGATFSLVRKDIQGNVDKVRVRFEKDQEGQKYLQQLIDADLAEHGGKFGIATEGLLWLKRGLQFMLELLTEMVTAYNSGLPRDKTEDLSGAVATAYGKSLKRHHGFIAKQAFKVVTMAVPYRRQILKAVALGQEGLDDVCIHHIQCHLDNFRLNVKTLVDYYIEKKLDTPDV